MDSSGRSIRWLFRSAAILSWRTCLLAVALLALPLGAAVWVLNLAGDAGDSASVAITIACYPISLYAHELAHLCGVRWFAPHLMPAVRLEGTWRRARLERPSAGALEDACISIAGPIAGLAMLLPVVFLSTDPIYLLPWVLLFHSHLFALSPWSSDGQQILHVLLRNHDVSSN